MSPDPIFSSEVNKTPEAREEAECRHAVVDSAVLCPEAPSKDAVRDVCVQSHGGPSRRLTETTAAALSIPAGQAAQVRPRPHVHTCLSQKHFTPVCLRNTHVPAHTPS